MPVHVQIRSQVKFAYASGVIHKGDVLPSIRDLAGQLGVGAGEVRRAYRELCFAGLLQAVARKHIVRPVPEVREDKTSELLREALQQCTELMDWARSRGIHPMSFGRLVLEEAIQRESIAPSYVFVDFCRTSAEASAAAIASAWDIRISGISVDAFRRITSSETERPRTVDHFQVILASHFVADEVKASVPENRRGNVMSVGMRLPELLRRRVDSLPYNARVLVVLPDGLAASTHSAVIRHYRGLFGKAMRVGTKPIEAIPDIARVASTDRYQLMILCPLAWKTSVAVRRRSRIAPSAHEPDPDSLERARVASGVLM